MSPKSTVRKSKVQSPKSKVSAPRPLLPGFQPLFCNPHSQIGFSLLDLLIALLVLTVVLLAAAKQFGAYTQPAVQPAPQTESTPAQP